MGGEATARALSATDARSIRVLCLDIEGGYGGSSRSLYFSLKNMDRDLVAPEVWCRKAGPIQAAYEKLDIPCRVTPEMTNLSAVPRLSRNVVQFGRGLWQFQRAAAFRHTLAREINDRFDLVHFNIEGLFLTAKWLRPRVKVPFTVNIRKIPPINAFARWQLRTLSSVADHVIFISEKEEAYFRRLSGTAPGTVIYNIVELPEETVKPHPVVVDDKRFKVASLANYSWGRGTDRVVDVAEALRRRGRRDVVFVMAGDLALPRTLPGILGRVARRGGGVADYARERGVEGMFLFLGHTAEPERVLAACDALIKPARKNVPWGRDLLEAMLAGKPVITTGSLERFVENGITGILHPDFDPDAMAEEIIELVSDPARCTALGAAARERAARLCSGRARAGELAEIWKGLAGAMVRHAPPRP